MTLPQFLALIIFLAMFLVIAWGWLHRTPAALVAGLLVALLVLRSPAKVFLAINWETIIFLGGMMVMVAALSVSGFFRWLSLQVVRLVRFNIVATFFAFFFLSAFLSQFIDSITVLLFLAGITVELSRMMGFRPVPFIIAFIFAANAGGAATMSGDPPNVIIGTAFGYSFMDFALNTGPIAWAGVALGGGLFYLILRPTFRAVQPAPAVNLYPSLAIAHRQLFLWGIAIFALVVALLVSHGWLGLSVAEIGLVAAALSLLAGARQARHILREVDWNTLLFFLGLFVVVGGLEETGLLRRIANFIGEATGGQMSLAILFILWFSATASAVVDNIPLAAAMVPVVRELSALTGLDLRSLSWTLALGCDIGGNATPIGASANVVGLGQAEKAGHHISWSTYMRYAIPPTLVALLAFHLLLLVRYG